MGKTIILEILGRDLRVVDRHRILQLPLIIGRSYSSDIIVDDKFICPEHLVVEENDEGAIVVRDLNSRNGSYTHHDRLKGDLFVVKDALSIKAGDTIFRFTDSEFVVKPAVPKRMTERLTLPVKKLWWGYGLILLLLYVLLRFGFLRLFNYHSKDDRMLNTLLWTTALIVPGFIVWSGLWAVFAKIHLKNSYFTNHLLIALAGSVSFYFFDILCNFAIYSLGAFSKDVVIEISLFLSLIMGLGVWHLRYSTNMSSRWRWISTSSLVFTLAILILASTYSSSLDFSEDSPAHQNIKPIDFQLVSGLSIENFTQNMSVLENELLDEIASQE